MPVIDWNSIFGLTVHPLEMVIRGTVMFWFLYLLFRWVLRRDVGSVGMADVLILVIIADAAQNAMAGEYKSITDGVLLIATIALWNVLIDWLVFRVPALRKVLEPKRIVLVRNGRLNSRAMESQFMTLEELKAKLRVEGVDKLADVKLAAFEANGEFSVLKAGTD